MTSMQKLAVFTNGDAFLRDRLEADAVAAGWELVKGFYAASHSDLMRDVVRREFDALAIWSFDNVDWKDYEAINMIAECVACGVVLYAREMGMSTNEPLQRMGLQMAAVIAANKRYPAMAPFLSKEDAVRQSQRAVRGAP